jgi:cytosine/adenosine deaminase-related metal-dependent hydrolase
MGLILDNAYMMDLNPVQVECIPLRIEGDLIVSRGANVQASPGDEIVDCDGALVFPGLTEVTRLANALRFGSPGPISKTLYSDHLNPERLRLAVQAAAMDALRRGITTVIDMHQSSHHLERCLDIIEEAIHSVGLRGLLCHTPFTQGGEEAKKRSEQENNRFLKQGSADSTAGIDSQEVDRLRTAGLSSVAGFPLNRTQFSTAVAEVTSVVCKSLQIKTGKLTPGYTADIVITDYQPNTPLNTENALMHFLNGVPTSNVKDVLIGGKWVLRDRVIQQVEENDIRREARQAARELWEAAETTANSTK